MTGEFSVGFQLHQHCFYADSKKKCPDAQLMFNVDLQEYQNGFR